MNLSRKNNKNINKRSSKKLNKKSSKKSITKSSKKKVNKILSKKITKKLSKKLNGKSPGRRTFRNSVAVKTGGNPNITELENQIKSLKNQVNSELEKNRELRLDILKMNRMNKKEQSNIEPNSYITELEEHISYTKEQLKKEKEYNNLLIIKIQEIQGLIDDGLKMFNMDNRQEEIDKLEDVRKRFVEWMMEEFEYENRYGRDINSKGWILENINNFFEKFLIMDNSLKELFTRINDWNQKPIKGFESCRISTARGIPMAYVVDNNNNNNNNNMHRLSSLIRRPFSGIISRRNRQIIPHSSVVYGDQRL